jgi:hypothetical protein
VVFDFDDARVLGTDTGAFPVWFSGCGWSNVAESSFEPSIKIGEVLLEQGRIGCRHLLIPTTRFSSATLVALCGVTAKAVDSYPLPPFRL